MNISDASWSGNRVAGGTGVTNVASYSSSPTCNREPAELPRRRQDIPAFVRTGAHSKVGEAQLAFDRDRSFLDLLREVFAALVARDLPEAEVKLTRRGCVANPQLSLRLRPKDSNEEEHEGDCNSQCREDS